MTKYVSCITKYSMSHEHHTNIAHSVVERGGAPGLAKGPSVDVGSIVRYPDDDVSGVAQLVNGNQIQSVHLSRTN